MEWQKDKYREFVDAVISAAADYQRGTVMPWSAIEVAMGRGRNEPGGWRIIKRARERILADREIVTVAVDGVGLRFLPDDQAAALVPIRRQKRAYRQLNRGLKETRAVRDQHLTDVQRMIFVRQRQYMTTERRNIGRAYRESRKPGKVTAVRPTRRTK